MRLLRRTPGPRSSPLPKFISMQKGVAMADESEKNRLTRRGFLGVGSAALAAAGVLSVETLAGQEQSGQTPKGDRSKSDPGPTNTYLDKANIDSVDSPPTDAGGVPSFKYPISFG